MFETEKKEKEKKSEVPHQSTVTATMLAQFKHIECIVPKHCNDIATFHKIFIFNYGWLQFYILLFYFDL